MPESALDIATALLKRRGEGDTTAITFREAMALRELRARQRAAEFPDFRRLGFQVKLSPYLVSLLRLEEGSE